MKTKLLVFVLIVFVINLSGVYAKEKNKTGLVSFPAPVLSIQNSDSTEYPLLSYYNLPSDVITFNIEISAQADAHVCQSVSDQDYTTDTWPLGDVGASAAWVSRKIKAQKDCIMGDYLGKANSDGTTAVTAVAGENSLSVSGSLLGFVSAYASEPFNCPDPQTLILGGTSASAALDLKKHPGGVTSNVIIPFRVERDCYLSGTAYVYILSPQPPPSGGMTSAVHEAEISWEIEGSSTDRSLMLYEPGNLNDSWSGQITAGTHKLKVSFTLSHDVSANANRCNPVESIAALVDDGFAINIAFYDDTDPR
jgi:hypothetical protein